MIRAPVAYFFLLFSIYLFVHVYHLIPVGDHKLGQGKGHARLFVHGTLIVQDSAWLMVSTMSVLQFQTQLTSLPQGRLTSMPRPVFSLLLWSHMTTIICSVFFLLLLLSKSLLFNWSFSRMTDYSLNTGLPRWWESFIITGSNICLSHHCIPST